MSKRDIIHSIIFAPKDISVYNEARRLFPNMKKSAQSLLSVMFFNIVGLALHPFFSSLWAQKCHKLGFTKAGYGFTLRSLLGIAALIVICVVMKQWFIDGREWLPATAAWASVIYVACGLRTLRVISSLQSKVAYSQNNSLNALTTRY